jgi:RsiW-degrading membrane proteinase PrsW (M82 family)
MKRLKAWLYLFGIAVALLWAALWDREAKSRINWWNVLLVVVLGLAVMLLASMISASMISGRVRG